MERLFKELFAQLASLTTMEDAIKQTEEALAAFKANPTDINAQNQYVSASAILVTKLGNESEPLDSLEVELRRLAIKSNNLLAIKKGITVEQLVKEEIIAAQMKGEMMQVDPENITAEIISDIIVWDESEDTCQCEACLLRRALKELQNSGMDKLQVMQIPKDPTIN